jgi:hypothetical protein
VGLLTCVETGAPGASASKVPPATLAMPLLRTGLAGGRLLGAVDCAVPVVRSTGIVMISPFVSVTTSGVPLTGAPTVAVYVMGLPSDTEGVAVSVTGVWLFTSVTAVDTVAVLGSSFSKSPPVTPVMEATTGALFV